MSNSGFTGDGAQEDRASNMEYYDLLPSAVRNTIANLNLSFATKNIHVDIFHNKQPLSDVIYNILVADLIFSQQDLLDKYGWDHPNVKRAIDND